VVKTIREIGYRVLSENEDGSPRQILKCILKEGEYGKFFSLERHWVQSVENDRMVTKWARWTVNFPYDREEALKLAGFIDELIGDAIKSEFGR